jgi:formate C-acetyltransferase
MMTTLTDDLQNHPAQGLGLAPTNLLAHALSRVFALQFNLRSRYGRLLRTTDGWLNFSIALRTEDYRLAVTLHFENGRVRVAGGVAARADTTLIYSDLAFAREMLRLTPNELLLSLLKSRMRIEGNMSTMSLFNFLLAQLLDDQQKRIVDSRRNDQRSTRDSGVAVPAAAPCQTRLAGQPSDAVQWLEDPFLGNFGLSDFPRLARFLDKHFTTRPEICVERPLLLTRWFRAHGFETQTDGQPWQAVLRQGHALQHVLRNKQALIREDDLLGGTTTTKDIGVVLFPDAHGTLIWGELTTVAARELNPYDITPQDVDTLHHEVFPFWMQRNFKEWVRENYGAPLCQQLDERFAVYFNWKTVALSHTIADFPKLLRLGTVGMVAEIDARLASGGLSGEPLDALNAMKLGLDGLASYAANVALEASCQAAVCPDPVRRAELARIAFMCAHVPQHPARSLDEALQAIWLGWIALHMENTNAGLSLGRMDQWLQPYFAADMAACADEPARQACVKRAIELVGCFFLRCTDHLPLVPDIGNYLFGGSSSDQAITLGGVTPQGETAVNDMTYVFLKVTELLKLRDPNVNARFSTTKNSDTYLRRLCEVNLITTATPSLHGDENVMAALVDHHYPLEQLRDWSAVGCVEPTISGRHMGHTGCMMLNLVAAVEMALHDGWHPLMNWQVGPRTGAADTIADFEAFYGAFERQLVFLIDHATQYNHQLGAAHAALRPTPLLSTLIAGSVDTACDVTQGGAQYNTSGVACIGLADVVDSLMSVKQLVFERRFTTLAELRLALLANFKGYEKLHALVMNKVPKYGSGDTEALALANRVTRMVHDHFAQRRNFRGGRYTSGFWSMSNHVAFGSLTGALPSGRLAGKAFTPGLSPAPHASKNLLDNIRDIALIDPRTMDNNIAFNIKYVPSVQDSHARSVENMAGYVKTYFQLGGMQMQLNVVSSDTLKDAMAHPENYRDLLVRISGYNAYFVTLNRDMQIELIERTQFSP